MISAERSLSLIPDTIRGMLLPGESPLVYVLAQQFGQADAIGKESPSLRNSFQWTWLDVFDPFDGPMHVNADYVGSKLAGMSAGGALGSIGHRFNTALEAPGSSHLLLTSHRLAIVGAEFEKLLSLKQRELIYFSVERSAIASIRRAPRLFQRGRVRIDFVDGSWAMAMLGMFFTHTAKRLINAQHPHG